ncbi:MAG: hypothetical protein J7479_17105, partial [Roseiflexus sp.]|nr:hypothetical protein [Roseiflexus sp.]
RCAIRFGSTVSMFLMSNGLTSAVANELLAFCAHSYPGNWFDPRMLETGRYVGIRGENSDLLSVASVTPWSSGLPLWALLRLRLPRVGMGWQQWQRQLPVSR